MIFRAVLGAAMGGIVGALVWAGIEHSTGFEVGYVAWGIGVAVGGGALLLGRGCGGGGTVGVICAAIAAGSILGGKFLSYEWTVSSVSDRACHEMYAALKEDSGAYAGVDKTSHEAIWSYMIERRYVDAAASIGSLDEQRVADFLQTHAPMLEEIGENNPTFEEWKASPTSQPLIRAFQREFQGKIQRNGGFFQAFGLLDIVFIALGIGTAFKLGVAAAAARPSGAHPAGETPPLENVPPADA